MAARAPDRRIERSRRAILDAFGMLFFEHGYDGVDVQNVAAKANVGRSTFYRHFRSKEDLLVESLSPLFWQVAEACVCDDEPKELGFVCEHFWDNRRLARGVFSGHAMKLVIRALATLIEQRLETLPACARQRFPIALVAAQLASGQMAMLDEWLRGRGSCSPAQFAAALHRSGRAIVEATLLTQASASAGVDLK